MNILWISCGGALGAICRYGINRMIKSGVKCSFPLSILVVNVLGSFLFGMMIQTSLFKSGNKSFSFFMGVGFLGALTTFSGFSYESFLLLKNKEFLPLFFHMFLNNFLSLGAFFLGTFVSMLWKI